MQEGVFRLMAEAGIPLTAGDRGYRPSVPLDGFEAKVLKPQNVVEMIDLGSRDVGFAGADWVAELSANVVELLDTELDHVRLIAAAPPGTLDSDRTVRGQLVVASEYEQLTKKWIAQRGLDAIYMRSYGATEVFPPEDSDIIVDNTATGSTLRANGLQVIDELMTSSTRLYANPKALAMQAKREPIERLLLLIRSVLDARKRVMLEVNVSAGSLNSLIAILPCMREPTVSPLHGATAFAVKSAVPRAVLPKLIPIIKSAGGTDIVVSELAQIVP